MAQDVGDLDESCGIEDHFVVQGSCDIGFAYFDAKPCVSSWHSVLDSIPNEPRVIKLGAKNHVQ